MMDRMLYYPQRILESRLRFIRENYENVRELRVETDDDQLLYGWLIEKDLSRCSTVIYFGGNAEEVSLNIEEFNSKLHVNVVLFNYRGFGLSTGTPCEAKLLGDAQRIYEFVVAQFSLQGHQVVVMGRSLGSGIAIHLALKTGSPKIILITPYDSIRQVAYDYFPKFMVDVFLRDRFEIIEICDQLQTSVLLLVAGRDEIIHPKHAENLYRKIRCSKKLVYIENSTHNEIFLYSQYWDAIVEYLAFST